MDDNLMAQVRQRLRERDTENLLEIWSRADGEEWSDEAYDIVRETLLERGVQPPDPDEASDSEPDKADEVEDVYHSFNRLRIFLCPVAERRAGHISAAGY
jgi:hypothetical protein